MKEKDFEVIVPAYDALEAELEEILGGGCKGQCKLVCPGYKAGNCAKEGEYTVVNDNCCEGLIAVPVGDKNFVCLAVEL